MRYTAPVTGAAVGAVIGFVEASDSKAQRWYCAPKEHKTWASAAALVLGAGAYRFTGINPDIAYGSMIAGAAFLGQRLGEYIVAPKDICPGSGCKVSRPGCKATSDPWTAGYVAQGCTSCAHGRVDPVATADVAMLAMPRTNRISPSGALT